MAKTPKTAAAAGGPPAREKTEAELSMERVALTHASLAGGNVVTRGYVPPTAPEAAPQSPPPGAPISIGDRNAAAEAGSDLVMRPAAVLIDHPLSEAEQEAQAELMAGRVADEATTHKLDDGRVAVTDVYGVTVVSAGSKAADEAHAREMLLAGIR